MAELNIKDKIIELSQLLDELDTFEQEIANKDQYYALKLSDLYHYIEDAKLDSKICYRFCKELKSVLLERRDFKNNAKTYYEFRRNKEKFYSEIANRKIALSKVCNESKKVEQSKYHNRIYKDNGLLKKIGE